MKGFVHTDESEIKAINCNAACNDHASDSGLQIMAACFTVQKKMQQVG